MMRLFNVRVVITYLRAKTNMNQGKSDIIAKTKVKLYLQIKKNTNTINCMKIMPMNINNATI